MKLRIFKQKRNAFLRKHTLTYPSGWPMMILLYMGVYEMGKRKNEYIFAPEKQKTGRLGCLATVLAMIVALVLATFLLNSCRQQPRFAPERARLGDGAGQDV